MKIRLCYTGNNETVEFAANEFSRYIRMIDSSVHVDVFHYDAFIGDVTDGLWLIWDPAYAPKVEDVEMDDAFRIDIKNNTGMISGTTPISVLIAVYSLLKKLGCAWIRPGASGELITKSKLSALNFEYEEKADYRFRGIDCDGKYVCDIIDWLPKEGMNNYFKEYLDPYSDYKRKYPDLSEEDFEAGYKVFRAEMKKRGIKYHTAGHGWHMTAIDFDSRKMHGVKLEDLTEEQISCLAMRDGKRCLYRDDGMMSGTQLCYSQKKVRDNIINDIVNYAKKYPDVDYLHFWLADGLNNHCECEDCVTHRPSDWYVKMLNELDRRLTEEGIKSRIVFLIYVDLLWEPVEFKIENPDRFILMFAPITRTYDTSYADYKNAGDKTPYVRNKLEWPRSAVDSVAYLRDWQEHQTYGDSFLFDYHLMWNQYKAPGYRNLAKVIYEDMYNLKNIGIDGNISCEIAECHIPNDFPHRIMARTLWNRNVDFYEEEIQCYKETYGEDFELAFDYLKKVTDAFSVVYDYYNDKEACRDRQKALAPSVERIVSEFKPVIKKNLAKALPEAQHLSWELMSAHVEFILPYARAYTAKYEGDVETSDKYIEELIKVGEGIDARFPEHFNFKMAPYSIKFYCGEITDNGARVVLI